MPHHHDAIGAWQVSVPLTVVLVFVAAVYLSGWLRLRSTAEGVAPWRAFIFLCGTIFIWIAVASPFSGLDHELLTVHMIQHLLLMTIAPPLIWLGEPVKAFSRGLPRRFVNTTLDKFFRLSATQSLGWAVTQPVFCLFAASAVLVGWHIPAAFALGMRSEAWHMVQQATFLGAGLLFWWPVVQPWPATSRPEMSTILYLFFATLPCDVLSGFLVFCDRAVYPLYLSSSRMFGFSALGDQQCAGALMWTCVTIVYLATAAVFTMRLLSPHDAAMQDATRSDSGADATSTLIQQRVEAVRL
jgi:cytochrome c oxidase assembly factor CtaG